MFGLSFFNLWILTLALIGAFLLVIILLPIIIIFIFFGSLFYIVYGIGRPLSGVMDSQWTEPDNNVNDDKNVGEEINAATVNGELNDKDEPRYEPGNEPGQATIDAVEHALAASPGTNTSVQ